MKYFRLFILTFLMLSTTLAYSQEEHDTIFQVSTIKALLEGVYDGDISFNALRKHGDHGMGTFNGLDGEMICIDGEFLQIRADGKVYPVKESMLSPFAVMTFFENDLTLSPEKEMDLDALYKYIGSHLESKNIFYAIRIDGTFEYVKTRNVPSQKKPYPPLVEIAEKQPVFEFHKVEGTLIGFYLPEYMKELNVPGYHLHFITANREGGGHLLDLRSQDITIKIDTSLEFSLILPKTEEFFSVDLSGQKEKDLYMVENE